MKNKIVGFLKIVLMSMVMFHVGALPLQANDKEPTKQVAKAAATININTAGPEELVKLPRIGPSIAKRIIEFRDEHGKFKSPEEIMNVRGIGTKTFENIKTLISVE